MTVNSEFLLVPGNVAFDLAAVALASSSRQPYGLFSNSPLSRLHMYGEGCSSVLYWCINKWEHYIENKDDEPGSRQGHILPLWESPSMRNLHIIIFTIYILT